MRKPRLLDLFCGGGGAARGYQQAGFHVTGVDINLQPRYAGDEFIQGDALTFPLDGFDAIHASPPCQGYSTKTFDPSRHPRLIPYMRARLIASGVPYVIENVEGARSDLRSPIRLCGSSFGLGVRRHRLFASPVLLAEPPCRHDDQPPRYRVYDHGHWYLSRTVPVFGTGGGKAAEHWAEAMGIDWMTRAELAEAIPPAYTNHVGAQLLAHLEAAAPWPTPDDITEDVA